MDGGSNEGIEVVGRNKVENKRRNGYLLYVYLQLQKKYYFINTKFTLSNFHYS